MINAVNEQFSRFVSFAEDRMAAGKDKAIASKGDIEKGGGTTLEERKIKVSSRFDWVALGFFRGDGAQRDNNEVRELFRKSVADMFGGEKNIPQSVKDAMLLKDYGHGKPLTARRIIAVKNAIENLHRDNVFSHANDPDGELADKAIAAGYTRLDFGKLNTAANLLAKAAPMPLQVAFEQVITKGSAANRTMNAGSLYMKDSASFREGYANIKEFALRDGQNLTFAKDFATEASAGQLKQIAENLVYKYKNILNDAEKLRAAANIPEDALAELRAAANSVVGKMEQIASGIASGDIKGRKAIYNALFKDGGVSRMADIVEKKICPPLAAAAKNNPAIAEFREYISSHIKEAQKSYDNLEATYRKAVAEDMAVTLQGKLNLAAHQSGINTGKGVSIPQAILDGMGEILQNETFQRMDNIDRFCEKLEAHGDASLRFSDAQKAALKELVEQVFGKGPRAEKLLKRLIDQFETAFFADELRNPTDFGNMKPTKPEIVLNHFKSDPQALRLLETGFKLDTEEDVETVKNAVKKGVADGLNKCLAIDPSKDTSLSTGLMPLGVREYNPGTVTFEGRNIPNAKFGTKFTNVVRADDIGDSARFGYAEFLEEKFDAQHKKMRQFVSFACSMAEGLGGEIDALIDHGGENSNLKAPPRYNFHEKGSIISPGNRHPDDNYNIEIAENGDVTITMTHIVQNRVTTLADENGVYTPSVLGQSLQGPMLGEVKVVATMTIKNASDAELGDKMPEFTIDDIKQEEM